MALPLGKLTILIGAGIVGSVLANEGRLPTASDFFSGAFKSVWKRLGTNDSSAPSAKPKNDAWLKQVDSLREEIQFYASRRPVTIVTSTSSGGRKYYIVVVIIMVGGYLWWKGWKLPDLRFATRRSLSDARVDIENKLQNVHSSIASTKQQVSVKLGDLDTKLDETHKNSEETHKEVRHLLREDVRSTDDRVKSVLQAVEYLETTVDRFEGKQGILFTGMRSLLTFVRGIEDRKATAQIEGSASRSSRSALGLPQPTPSRAGSLPSNLLPEPVPPSPSTLNGSFQQQQQKQGTISDSGLKLDLVTNGKDSSIAQIGASSETSSGSSASTSTSSSSSSGFGISGGKFIGSVVTRSRSLKLTFNI